MKQKLAIFVLLIVVIAILVGLNAATYTQKEKQPDSESFPNRSTFNSGATGTQAFYTLLAETGRSVVRWQDAPAALHTARKKPAVFVVTGYLRRPFTDEEIDSLLRWVSEGGRLVLIDRQPVAGLLVTSAMWKVTMTDTGSFELFSMDPSVQAQMIAETPAIKPVQPTVLTASVNAVQPSRFASTINFERIVSTGQENGIGTGDDEAPPPPPSRARFPKPPPEVHSARPSDLAPVVHFASNDKNLVADMPYGEGRIVILSDPYIVSNGGIGIVDNAQLGINLVATNGGTIAFDEYHQGYGSDQNRFLQFFAGTPVVAIFLQAVVLIGFIFYSQSRRFARAVPEPEADRLSKLEYVSAMAELQQRTRAFDLAIENIYSDFRRRATKVLGLDNMTAKAPEIALAISERTGLDRSKMVRTLSLCEEIIHGEPTTKSEVLNLASELREIENRLGLHRARHDKV